MRRPPIARADRDKRLEGSGPGGERGRDREGIWPSPAGADERALPAMIFQRLRVACQRLQAVVGRGGGIAAVAGFDLVGNVPKEFGIAAHAMGLQFEGLTGASVSNTQIAQRLFCEIARRRD